MRIYNIIKLYIIFIIKFYYSIILLFSMET